LKKRKFLARKVILLTHRKNKKKVETLLFLRAIRNFENKLLLVNEKQKGLPCLFLGINFLGDEDTYSASD